MKNLRKLFCMIVAICVIACFAAPTVLAAEGTEMDPIVLEAGVSQTITIPAGGTVFVQVDATSSAVQVVANGNRQYWNFNIQAGMFWYEYAGPSGAAVIALQPGEVYLLALNNEDTEAEAVLDVSVETPAVGTYDNPDELKAGTNTAVIEAGSYGYYYTFTADVAGLLTITMGEGDWTYVINNLTTYKYGDTHYSDDDPVMKSSTVAVNAGDEIQLIVNSYDPIDPWAAPAGEVSFNVAFRVGHGTVEAPFEAHNASDLTSIEAAAGTLTYIGVNSQMNGMVLNVVAQDGIALIVNDKVIVAKNGVFSVVLDGVPMNKVVIANTSNNNVDLTASVDYPVGSESNPIMIGNAAELSQIEVAAGNTVYIAINGMLNGNNLSIKGDANTVLIVNGQTITAENGVFSVELNGAPMNRVMITNNGTADATYTASIGDPIPATGSASMVLPMILALVAVMGMAVVATKKFVA